LDQIQKDEICDLVKFLKILRNATSAMEGTNRPTIHCVLAMYEAIEKHIQPDPNDKVIISEAKNNIRTYYLLTKLENKHLLTSIFHKMGIYLHPAMKLMSKLSPDDQNDVLKEVCLLHLL
jgi:hypothetical protein